ncbi:MAG TPA: hypothetical protein VGS79_17200 [Puia sp.]|nr:hypothetical protein [Puia sp.]
MAAKTVFSDLENNEMECYINQDGKLYIGVSLPDSDGVYSGFITLDKADVSQLIKILSELKEEMED